MSLEYTLAVWIYFAVESRNHPGSLKAQIKTTYTRKKRRESH
jgi:hypothetical protein